MTTTPILVAVVDDEEPIRRALRRLLTSAGFEVVVFGGGDEFLSALPSGRPECVVLDLHMPNTDGFGVLESISRERRPLPLPVVVVTGHDTPETHQRVMDLGARGYLRKPIDGQQLINAIHEAVGRT